MRPGGLDEKTNFIAKDGLIVMQAKINEFKGIYSLFKPF